MGVTAEAYAATLTKLLPRGRLWRRVLAGVLSKILLALGDSLARIDQRAIDLLTEGDPTKTLELLPEYEADLGLSGDGTIDERRARVIAQLLRQPRFRPIDFRQVLAPVMGCTPAQVIVIERSHADAVSMGDAREIYHFFIKRDPAATGPLDVDAVQSIISTMKPAHTNGQLVLSTNFICDDPDSLCDRDILGV